MQGRHEDLLFLYHLHNHFPCRACHFECYALCPRKLIRDRKFYGRTAGRNLQKPSPQSPGTIFSFSRRLCYGVDIELHNVRYLLLLGTRPFQLDHMAGVTGGKTYCKTRGSAESKSCQQLAWSQYGSIKFPQPY